MRNRLLSRQILSAFAVVAATCAVIVPVRGIAAEAEPTDAVTTVNHAFATELGTGIYDIGGQSIFVVRVTPSMELREAKPGRPGIRLVAPLAAGSFDFNPLEDLEVEVPERIDSFSIMPGLEFDMPQGNDWVLTPWVRAGASFSAGQSDGLLFGAGARLTWNGSGDKVEMSRLHELLLAGVDYNSADVPDDKYLRFRNAVDLRRPTFRLSEFRRLQAGLYAIVDVVTDPPDLPLAVEQQSVVQLELGVTFNTTPRLQIRSWRLPRLGFGYRIAGDFSGWRLIVGAPF